MGSDLNQPLIHQASDGDDRAPEEFRRARVPFAMFSSTLNNSGFGLTRVDPQTRRYLYANAAFCRMVGYSVDELTKGPIGCADLIDPDDAERCFSELDRLIRGEIDSFTVENRYFHKDGSVVPARVIISAVERDSDNQAVLTMGVVVPLQPWSAELTSQKHGLSFWSLSLHDQGRFCSESLRVLLDLPQDAPCPSRDELIGRIHPEDRGRVSDDIERATRGSFQSSEYRVIRPSGEVRWVSQSLKPIFDASSKVVGIVATCLDFTEVTRSQDASPSSATVKIVQRHVDQHWDQPLTVGDLAQVAGVNVRTLFKHFRHACGFTPQEYIKRVRLNQARTLLRTAGRATTVLGVALRCRFQNQGHFARDYRLAFGELPSKTLERARQLGAGAEA